MPNNDFATRLEALMEILDVETDHLKRHYAIQKRDALLLDHAPAIAKVVRVMPIILAISDRKHDAWDEAKSALAELNGGGRDF